MASFENFVKSMPPSLSELKVSPSFCFPFKIPDDPIATNMYGWFHSKVAYSESTSFSHLKFSQISQIPNNLSNKIYLVIFHQSTI